MKFSLDGGAVGPAPGQHGGAGWRLDPGQVRAVLSGLDDVLGPLCQDAGGLSRVVADMAAPRVLGVRLPTFPGPSAASPVVEDYHGLPEWGSPFGEAVVVALDEALCAQAAKVDQVVGAVCAAVVGVSQATDAYEAGAEDMAATVQVAAARAASTGDFSYFDYLAP